ncbi:tRNA pseudouridine(55) synthase TruB [Candidatus Falkowbacteria bacterium CG_4_10_14_0_2_um_filter_41_15]|uniref:tRNA pseudouridine synthase B n=3 Tax=Candidatus Falkowiibacteriota TaxID=1752728 RepID=A0A2G9ZNW5_9BACT|nr:MAG: tRNA pseudouridine(55) synthase TruB [Candidatus Falkowbacteria bacterium CG23_combo_of_CG06-09_8_20_14_all_41_10]PIZ10927.1 MAG: tRNA pseudouridine(55) synthase TruB [Candidatus Falkowbacteria bacterium CG_4_10_14_0_8_um_filter_41_36]PJA10560.1 MAG: tRNA pseudouridine(55) synthase TruB [Candidatus Falkowbacteria bacterium CG_4_10_14_0_2_um_filter_41_15]
MVIYYNSMDSGFILINKPLGISSHAVVSYLRHLAGIRKIGHAGTLDPQASGLMILAVGRAATKNISQFVKMDKEYEAEIHLGITTDTYDREGKILSEYQGEKVDESKIILAINNFLGEQEQQPPMYSAKKVKGQKLYNLARQGKEIDRPKQKITISGLEIIDYSWPILRLKVACSSGTYIRTLAYDFGTFLGVGAYLSELRRTKVGSFTIDQAVELGKIDPSDWSTHLF